MLEQRIGFIGAGQMATTLAGGLVDAGLSGADRLLAADPDQAVRQRFLEATGIPVVANNSQVLTQSNVIVLAVKPQKISEVAAELRGSLKPEQLVLSIAAGVSLQSLAELFGRKLRIVRAMPNAPCLIRRGASAYSLGSNATAVDAALVGKLLGALGTAWQVDEKLLDAVTSLASSGPALVYVMIEAMSDAGVGLGLSRDMATTMAAHAVRGAAEMVLQTGEHPAVLKDRVASPAGTTIAGLRALESGGFRMTLMAAIDAAARRSSELGAHGVSKQ